MLSCKRRAPPAYCDSASPSESRWAAAWAADRATQLRAAGASGLLKKRLPLEKLMELAAELGSDVPFFLMGGTAVGLGRGTELYPLPDAQPSPGLLITPGIHSSTAAAYAALERKVLRRGFNRYDQQVPGAVAWDRDRQSPTGRMTLKRLCLTNILN